jgi:hypothetical protein
MAFCTLALRVCAPQISADDEGVDRADPAIIAFESAMGFGNQAVLNNFRRDFK